MTPRVAIVVIRVQELDRAAAFYEALGLAFVREKHGSGREHLSCDLGGVVFELYPRRPTEQSTSATRIGFTVGRMDMVLAALQRISATVVSPAADGPWGRRAVASDPDGHMVEIFQARDGNEDARS